MVAEPLVVEFHRDNRDAVVTRMAAMAGAHQGWINFTPGLDVDVPPPPRSALFGLFTARGPDVPLGTWHAPPDEREPITLGIQHGRGPRGFDQLADIGISLPESWRKLQDHPKRGLVWAAPPTTNAAELDRQLEWLLTATAAFCPLPLTGEWRALCYRAI